MNENEYLAKTACHQLEQGLPLVLVSILSMQGSTPRQSGTKMVVTANGKSYGTIGGSLLEATAIKKSMKALASAQSRLLTYELTGQDATAPGMICGGTAELLLDFIPATAGNSEFFRCWLEAIRHDSDFYFLTHISGSADTVKVQSHSILYPDGRLVGKSMLLNNVMESLRSGLANVMSTTVVPIGNDRMVIDRMRRLTTLFCFGAGHVAQPTAHIASLVGFRVVVVDDRPEFANTERFPDASRICVLGDYDHALAGMEIDADSFIVIVTRGHQYDRAVLEQALKTPAGYIGMISSRRKREAIYEALLAKGVTKEELERVHSPIGIDIGGETPEEIAVSIVAELIRERSKQRP